MAVQGPFKVEFDDVFPHGAGVVGGVSMQSDFDKSTRENKVQSLDRDSGLPVWVVDVMDFDPEARERTLRVKIASAVQPVPPEATAEGIPVRPVRLEGLMVTPYIKESGNFSKVAYSLRATAMVKPRAGRPEGRPESRAA